MRLFFIYVLFDLFHENQPYKGTPCAFMKRLLSQWFKCAYGLDFDGLPFKVFKWDSMRDSFESSPSSFDWTRRKSNNCRGPLARTMLALWFRIACTMAQNYVHYGFEFCTLWFRIACSMVHFACTVVQHYVHYGLELRALWFRIVCNMV